MAETLDQGPESPAIDPNTPRCHHLRNKELYVFDGVSDETHGEHEATNFWCLHTMKGFGPDDQMVGRLPCRDTSRGCYEPS